MNKTTRIIIAIAVVAVAGLAFVARQTKTTKATAPGESPVMTTMAKPVEAAASPATATITAKLPKLIDLGAGKCIPCKMMAPILVELRKEFAGRMEVVFIDVWENPDAGKPYGIEVIPTQIFFDAGGKELFRHVGFFAKDDILAKWKELGLDLAGKPQSRTLVREDTAAVSTNLDAKEPISESTPGKIVDSLAEVDALFGDMNAAFLFVPATNGPSSVNWVPMNRARRNLEAEWDIKLGVFALKPDSRDYGRIAARASQGARPAVMVILYNGATSVLSGELSETNLVQEFVYAVGAGGCCPLGDD